VAAAVESEIKLEMAGPEAARQRVRDLAPALVRPRHFEDNLLLDDESRSLVARGLVLRIRRTAEASVLTYKGPRREVEGVKSRPEIEVHVSSAEAGLALLDGLGFRPVFRYQKYRETYRWRQVEIVIDETPVGTFLEIEGPVAAIHEAAQALGYGQEDYILDSYAALFLARGGRGDMVFE
jgi:adenylate cyclase, class 2